MDHDDDGTRCKISLKSLSAKWQFLFFTLCLSYYLVTRTQYGEIHILPLHSALISSNYRCIQTILLTTILQGKNRSNLEKIATNIDELNVSNLYYQNKYYSTCLIHSSTHILLKHYFAGVKMASRLKILVMLYK